MDIKALHAHLQKVHEKTAAYHSGLGKSHAEIAAAHESRAAELDQTDKPAAAHHRQLQKMHNEAKAHHATAGKFHLECCKALSADPVEDHDRGGDGADLDGPKTDRLIRTIQETVKAALDQVMPTSVRAIIPSAPPAGVTPVPRHGQPAIDTSRVAVEFQHLVSL